MTDDIAHAVFGLLFETSPDAALIVERVTGRIVSANVRAADMLARPTDVLLGMPFGDLLEDRERDVTQPGRYEDVTLHGGDGYPVYVTLQVAHVETEQHGALAAYMARDMTERRLLESEVMAKHTALFTAHAELEKAHAQLTETRAELAMLAWRAAMGELVAGIAHHLNNPVGALASTVRRLKALSPTLPPDARDNHERLLARVDQIARRIESNVAAIVSATRANASAHEAGKRELPAELTAVLATFAQRLDDIPTKEPT